MFTEGKTRPITYAFIDSQHVNLAIRDQGRRLDFREFRRYHTDKHHIAKAFLFMGYMPEYEKLYTHLRVAGFCIVFKPIVEQKRIVKGNVDAELVLHSAAIEFQNYDKAIIVTGYGDFHCLIEYLKHRKKLAKLIVQDQRKYSSLLRKFSDNTVFMNQLKHRLSAYRKERH